LNNLNYKSVLGKDGLLERGLPGFKPRQVQLEMAEAVAGTLKNNRILVVEAATGTGKTFSYLVPALLSGKKIIISTGTKNLQDQLFHHDLPILRKLIKLPFKVALLKGRSNYLCKHRIELHNEEGGFLPKNVQSQLYRIKMWSGQTRQGDIAEIKNIAEKDTVWPLVTSNKDNCIGQDCEYFDDCFVMKARQRALKADIIVINHHLFFSDLALKESGFGELLPNADAIIFDEAHQLHDIASNFLGMRFGSRQLSDLMRDTETELVKKGHSHQEIMQDGDKIITAIGDMRLALGNDKTRKPWAQISNNPKLVEAIAVVKDHLASFCEKLKVVAPSAKGLASCWERAQDMQQGFQLVTGETPLGEIHWFETFARSFNIYLTPLNIAKRFGKYLYGFGGDEKSEDSEDRNEGDESNDVADQEPLPKKAWIFTSATLAVGEDFNFFCNRMGIKSESSQQMHLKTVFDYQKQAALYLPQNLPNPTEVNYIAEVVEAAIAVIEIAQGRTFFLFTSHNALQFAARILPKRIRYPILVQGTMPKLTLLQRFRELSSGGQGAVLLGTSSFWEGVDVKGEALSCVIIDKLPFASPYDPILQARINAMRKEGSAPFFDYQIPQAAIALKQGVGRLIRDVSDTGLLMLCDPRLRTKGYGKIFMNSLPDIPVVQSLLEVQEFFESIGSRHENFSD